MYAGVPKTEFASLRVVQGSTSPSASSRFARPKSRIFTIGLPSEPRTRERFAGLMSRCTICTACASASASHAWSVAHRHIDREVTGFTQLPLEVATFEELHRDERRPVRQRAHVEDPHAVLAPEHRGRARFPEESRQLRFRGAASVEQLQRDGPLQRQVLGREDDAHASAPDEPIDLVNDRR
jgi:hypothetical protein